MDQRLGAILDSVVAVELEAVAAGALGVAAASLVGPIERRELMTPHFDRKTIGIVRVSGKARLDSDGVQLPWSAVAKISDLSLAPNEGSYTRVEDEATFYEKRIFADDGMRFRPARCYAISRPDPSLRVLWLEDLTAGSGAPFDVAAMNTMVRHLGEWNGHHALRQTAVDIRTDHDAFAIRWKSTGFGPRLGQLATCADTPAWREAFGGLPPSVVIDLHDLLGRLVAQNSALPHGIAFGDLAAGNVILKDGETVAIDWASLTMDPVGVDGGCLVGSMLTWAGCAAIAAAEAELFEAYLDGLRVGGWAGEPTHVRRAFLSLYGIYMMYCGLMPVFTAQIGKPFSREFLEGRWKTTLEELPEEVAGVIQRFPPLIAELARLVG